jgi:hypothetical protein
MDGETIYRLTNSYGRLLYPRSRAQADAAGPSGIEPYEPVWRPAEQSLADLADASEHVASL